MAFVLDVSVTVSWCLAEADLPVGTLDLNADSTVGAAWAGDRVADGHTLWHAQENAQREKTLQQVARNQRASGTPVQGERSNQALWQSIRGRDAALAWRNGFPQAGPAIPPGSGAAGVAGRAMPTWPRP